MSRFLFPLLLIAAAVGIFVMFSDDAYKDVQALRAESAEYDQALLNSRELKEARDQLLVRYNSFSINDIARLRRMVPETVDNIRLIIEIEKIAAQYGMALRDVKFEAEKPETEGGEGVFITETPEDVMFANRPYDEFELEFTTQGTYANFISFLEDLERNLRIVDVQDITFSSSESSNGVYNFDFKVKTYWLKS